MDMEVDLGLPTEGLLDEAVVDGIVGVRRGCCWRIRRRPDSPSPWSWSVNMGDLLQYEESLENIFDLLCAG